MKRNILYCIFGASGSGKTTLLQNLVYVEKICKSVKKYSTRQERPATTLEGGIKVEDDSIHVSREELERICDIIYESSGNHYGFSSLKLVEALQEDDVMIVLSDIRALKLLKAKLKEYKYETKIIYLSSKMESPQQFLKVWQNRIINNEKQYNTQTDRTENSSKCTLKSSYDLIKSRESFFESLNVNNLIVDICNFGDELRYLLPESDTYRNREEKIRLIYTRYIHNIGLFDHVILNYGDTIQDMVTQGKNIINYNKKHRLPRKQGPVIFILCASPKSGKGTLMENLNIMGASKILITPKYAGKEKPEPNTDAAREMKRDGMVMKGIEGFKDAFGDESGDFWKWKFHVDKQNPDGISYAVRIDEIKNRLKKGISQVFVANFDQVKRLREDEKLQEDLKDIKDKFVFVYLHRVRGTEELDEQFKLTNDDLKDKKIIVRRGEVTKVYRQYIENISSVQHVLINPSYLTYREDLHDQMMSLIELYSPIKKIKKQEEKNMILIIGGSGVGKTYILQNIEKLGSNYKVIKKYSTRKARKSEDSDKSVDLYFNCDKSDVLKCDYSYTYRDEYYGFYRSDIEDIFREGKIPLFVVRRMKTIKQLKKDYPFASVIHCKSGLNYEALFKFLLSKGNTEKDLKKRLNTRFEIENQHEYQINSNLIDYTVINDYDERFLEEIKICLPK